MEHLAHNTKNIKVTLDFMTKYILNKKVNNIKANDVTEFEGIGDAIWNFILLVYEAKWDSLYTDCSTSMLRSKILLKFTPRIPSAVMGCLGHEQFLFFFFFFYFLTL